MNPKIASLWTRVGGALIDLIIVMIVSSIVIFIWALYVGFNGTDLYLTAEQSSLLWKSRGMLVGIVVDGILATVLMAGDKQATFGQRAVGIQTVKDDGTKLGYDTAFGRWLVSLFSSVILKIGFAIALFTKNKKTLHDLLAGTVVVTKDESTNNFYQSVTQTKNQEKTTEQKVKKTQANDEHIYEQVYEELFSDKRNNGLYIKILTQTDGNKEQAEIQYIKTRVEQLKEQIETLNATTKRIKFKLNSKSLNDELLNAVRSKDSATASQLLKSGISNDGTDDDGYTLMEIAISNKDNTMQQLLKAYGAKG